MSVPYAKLPAWVDYGLIPLINLIVAFLVAGLVVLAVGESPLRAASLPQRRRPRKSPSTRERPAR